jgi:hypothetical protein
MICPCGCGEPVIQAPRGRIKKWASPACAERYYHAKSQKDGRSDVMGLRSAIVRVARKIERARNQVAAAEKLLTSLEAQRRVLELRLVSIETGDAPPRPGRPRKARRRGRPRAPVG